MAGSSGAHERKARAPRPAVRSSAVLKALSRNGERVFPLSNMAINQLLRGMRPGGGVAPHGFRVAIQRYVHDSFFQLLERSIKSHAVLSATRGRARSVKRDRRPTRT